MLGVILCGGESTRMNSDKGMLKLSTNTWAQVAANKIASLQLSVVLSVNELTENSFITVTNKSISIIQEEELINLTKETD